MLRIIISLCDAIQFGVVRSFYALKIPFLVNILKSNDLNSGLLSLTTICRRPNLEKVFSLSFWLLLIHSLKYGIK